MNHLEKYKYRLIAHGIVWIWVYAIMNQYIDIDGWVLYAVSYSGIFLLVVVGFYLLCGIDRVHRCTGCGEIFHELDNKDMYWNRDAFYQIWRCDACYLKRKEERARLRKEEEESK